MGMGISGEADARCFVHASPPSPGVLLPCFGHELGTLTLLEMVLCATVLAVFKYLKEEPAITRLAVLGSA